MGILQAINSTFYLTALSLRRSLWSRQTIVCAALSLLIVGITYAWSLEETIKATDFSTKLVMPVFVAALLPIYCLCYASGTISSELSDRTLVYLLTSSLYRPLIHTAKFIAASLVTLLWTIGTFALMSFFAKPDGWLVFNKIWPSIMLATLAYVSLFHLFSIVFQRSTIFSLLYAIFLEILFSNMPGTAKRITVLFYTRCSLFDAGSEFGIAPENPDTFLPVSGDAATAALCIATVVLFSLGAYVFMRKEYV